MEGARALVLAADLLLRTRLEEAARRAGYAVMGDVSEAPAATLILVDLDQPGAIEQLARLGGGSAHPRIIGFLSHVDRERWRMAEEAGIEVHPRGASTRAAELLA